jgi:hypothetical protein
MSRTLRTEYMSIVEEHLIPFDGMRSTFEIYASPEMFLRNGYVIVDRLASY